MKTIEKKSTDSPRSEKGTSPPIVALAGNPNVGKSTVFNLLTGLHQHTGNWSGKTVSNARGSCRSKKRSYTLVDIPGTYSLLAHSAEEEVARDFICFEKPDITVVVCDATCLERNLNLVLQILEATSQVIVCVNLMDDAKRKGIRIDIEQLHKQLGVPVIAISARKKQGIDRLLKALDMLIDAPLSASATARIAYPSSVEAAVSTLASALSKKDLFGIDARWLSLKMLEGDSTLLQRIESAIAINPFQDTEIASALQSAQKKLEEAKIGKEKLQEIMVSASVNHAEAICRGAITFEKEKYNAFDRRLDKILTSRLTGFPIMILLLMLIFWLTITVSNYPSAWLSSLFGHLEDWLSAWLVQIGSPVWLNALLCEGILRVLGWVISVMLPPMAIFFPLFTLLEDIGYLPRVAYNLDRPFHCCATCGKQALTMCMGFGCNAVGVVGCRIIDSPRERLLAILTNSFVPCNGRFPALISILTMFFIGLTGSVGSAWIGASLLTLLILIGIVTTFAVTKILSLTLLRGTPSSFTLELPPYRPPQIGQVLVRCVLDRTLFVLGRAVSVAAPAGLLIWLMANIQIGDASILGHSTALLDPFARLFGMDGVILTAFLLGFPANEIVIPIMIMCYLSNGSITEFSSLTQMKALFVANGWTLTTAICVLIFFLMHWPCSTTLLTVKKETGSVKWTCLAAIIPTAVGLLLCFLVNLVSLLISRCF